MLTAVSDCRSPADDNKCAECDNCEENWLCLKCHTVHCGRFASSHARKHAASSTHHIACGLADLSFWCYQCDSYLHHLSIKPVYEMYRTLHVLKFGEEAVEVQEFAQPGVFRIEEEREEKEAAEQPLSLSAGMNGASNERERTPDESESKSKPAAAKQDLAGARG